VWERGTTLPSPNRSAVSRRNAPAAMMQSAVHAGPSNKVSASFPRPKRINAADSHILKVRAHSEQLLKELAAWEDVAADTRVTEPAADVDWQKLGVESAA
jgi:hypothetical protein